MNAPVNAIGLWLIDFYVAATLLLSVGLIGTLLVRQPARRLAVGWATMAGLALLLFLCALPQWPRVSWLTLPGEASASAAVRAGEGGPIEATALRQMDPNRPPGWLGNSEALAQKRSTQPAPSAESTTGGVIASDQHGVSVLARLVPWLVALFAAGASLVAFWLILGAAQTLRLRRNATAAPAVLQAELERLICGSPVSRRACTASTGSGGPDISNVEQARRLTDDIRSLRAAARPVSLLISPRVAGPIATGVFRPAIIVPTQLAADATPQGLALVLAHEWAHVRNRDLWLLALGRALLLVLFAHPLYWWLQRRNHHDQEAVADAEVVDRASRTDYAKELVNWAQRLHGRPSIYVAALGIWERPSSLTRRVKMILDETRRIHARCSRRWRAASFAAAGLLTVAVSLLTLQPGRSVAADPANAPARSEDGTGVMVVSGQLTVGGDAPKRGESIGTLSLAGAGKVTIFGGTVVDETTGKPIRGATVALEHWACAKKAMPKLLGKTEKQTDASGRYDFEMALDAASQKNERIVIRASHPGYLSATTIGGAVPAALLAKQKGPLPSQTISLAVGEPIQGTVVGPDGKPVEGIEVRVMSYPSPRMMIFNTGPTDSAEADGDMDVNYGGVGMGGYAANFVGGDSSGSHGAVVTDRNGVFRDKVGKGHWAYIECRPKDYAPLARQIHTERGDLGQFKLAKPITLAGRVLDAEGRPLPGIEVSVCPMPSEAEIAKAQAEAEARVKAASAAKQKKSGKATEESGGIHVGAGTLTIRTTTVRVDDETARPKTTDEQGRYSVPRLAPGRYSIQLNMPRPATSPDGTRWPEPLPAAFRTQSVTLAERESTHTLDIRAVPHVTIAARCVDSAGKPAKGVILVIHNAGNGIPSYDACVGSGTDGRLSLKVPKGLTGAMLNAHVGGGLPMQVCRWRESKDGPLRNDQHTALGTLDHDMTDIEIIAYRSPTIVLRVTDENGQPIPGLRAKIVYPEDTLNALGPGMEQYRDRLERQRALMGDVPFMPGPKKTLRSMQLLPDQDFTLTVESRAGGYESRSEKYNLPEGATKEITWQLKKKR